MDIKRSTCQIKALGDDGSGVAVFATLGVVDSDGDVTLPGAFGEQDAHLLPAHDWSHVPLGKARIREEGGVALAEFQFNLEIQAARDWHAALRFDRADPARSPLQEWSYGYTVLDSAAEVRDGKAVRMLKAIKVYEVSPVVRGAGVGTHTRSIKQRTAGRPLAEQIDEVRAELLDLAARVRDLKSLRASEGRPLSAERLAEIGQVKAALDLLAPLASDLGIIAYVHDPRVEARKLYSAHVLHSRRSITAR